ncbi:MAG TPA: hydrogenase [Campylobacterales bacterium]|jgi:hydrogenase-4 component E|nr:hydrogenase [Campylobacterales bacterium]
MIDFFIGLFMASFLIVLFSGRLYRLIFWYAFNSLALGVITILVGVEHIDNALVISGGLTLILKAGVIPFVLKNISQRFNLIREINPTVPIHYSIILIPAIIIFTLYLAEPMSSMIGVNSNYIAISISSFFLALILMIEHKSVAPKIIAFLMMENALFLLGTTATKGMPMFVELGIFFDVMMAIVIINLLFKEEHVK